MANLIEKLQILLAPTVTALGFEWVGCELKGGERRRLLRIYIDGPTGIGIADCAKISRQLSAILDVEDIFPGAFDLEVSSPGLDRPLFSLIHYQQFVGKMVRLKSRVPQEGQKHFKGIITAVDDPYVVLQLEGGTLFKLAINDIEKGNLIPEYSKPR